MNLVTKEEFENYINTNTFEEVNEDYCGVKSVEYKIDGIVKAKKVEDKLNNEYKYYTTND